MEDQTAAAAPGESSAVEELAAVTLDDEKEQIEASPATDAPATEQDGTETTAAAAAAPSA